MKSSRKGTFKKGVWLANQKGTLSEKKKTSDVNIKKISICIYIYVNVMKLYLYIIYHIKVGLQKTEQA